ncbi:hypothetical protein [Streptococcus cuniculi]|uniref:Uncharacterized protein n=1 Tax=Streptococcus cuniculi TaxID=1432788 RepID=A0A4Y9JDP8_9STRE|nr:hypothetical protein [Streptococcus cuniculi]MBF0777858.1 hypothetical protein [Streptococcus cuniculi]TFU98156.1 hypothetical protein E4T82_03865 [Streptococcus cuniculi]
MVENVRKLPVLSEDDPRYEVTLKKLIAVLMISHQMKSYDPTAVFDTFFELPDEIYDYYCRQNFSEDKEMISYLEEIEEISKGYQSALFNLALSILSNEGRR